VSNVSLLLHHNPHLSESDKTTITGSGSASPHHNHHHHLPSHNPHTIVTTPEQKLSRLLLLLENQFGDAIVPINITDENGGTDTSGIPNGSGNGVETTQPGLEISVPPHTARVRLMDLHVECKNPALRSRVQAVVEKACETVAGIAG
jgi:Pre-mRNA 3'-end-processing endonuclease polyadenylation factor C-term